MVAVRPFQHAYRTLKREILAGVHVPGSQIKASLIAKRLLLSPTPVREALARLAGEGLIDDRRDQGYFAPLLEVRRASELYWLQKIILAALVSDTGSRRGQHKLSIERETALNSITESAGVAILYETIARQTANASAFGLVRVLNDKLAIFRRAEFEVVPEPRRTAMVEAFTNVDPVAQKRAILAYFDHCRRCVHEIIERSFGDENITTK